MPSLKTHKNNILLVYLVSLVLIVAPSVFGFGSANFYGVKYAYLILVGLFSLVVFDRIKYKKSFSYFKYNRQSLILNLAIFTPIVLIMSLFYVNGWYTKGDLSGLNLGIPYPSFPILYVLISVPLQQSLIFGDLLQRLSHRYSALVAISFTTVFYSLMHSYYPQQVSILIGTLVLGSIWGYISYKTKSIFGNLITHTVVGLLAMFMNLA